MAEPRDVRVVTPDGMILRGWANTEMTITETYDKVTGEVLGWEMVLRGTSPLSQRVELVPELTTAPCEITEAGVQ